MLITNKILTANKVDHINKLIEKFIKSKTRKLSKLIKLKSKKLFKSQKLA